MWLHNIDFSLEIWYNSLRKERGAINYDRY